MVNNTGTSFTLSHTCSGSTRVLIVGFTHRNEDDVTGVTYDGVAMTQLVKLNKVDGDEWLYIYGLIAPATGANDVVASFSSSQVNYYGAVSYNGCKQDGLPNTTDSLDVGTNETSITTTFTTTKDRCAAVAFSADGGTETAGAGATILNYLNGNGMLESSSLVIPTGEYSMTVNFSSATAAIVSVAIEPEPFYEATLETMTMTENPVWKWLETFTETITGSEPYLLVKKLWKNTTKSVSTWLNQDKN
jgi:hypothetical protein